MREARSSSPFADDHRHGQLEKWICRQHQQQELQSDQLDLQQEEKQTAERFVPVIAQQPRHSQYDAIISKMRSARRSAGQDQQWSG